MADRKQICIYGPACYRRNPTHFREKTHPYLEKLLDENDDDMPIQLPDKLDFVCERRSLLVDQLNILRKIKREECIKKEVSDASIDLPDEDWVIDFTYEDPIMDLTNKNPVMDLTNKGPIMDLTNKNPIMDLTNKNPIVDFTNNNLIMDLTDKDPIIDLTNTKNLFTDLTDKDPIIDLSNTNNRLTDLTCKDSAVDLNCKDPIIDLTYEDDDSPGCSQSKSESDCENSSELQDEINTEETIQCVVENYENTERRIEKYESTKRRFDNYENTLHQIENYVHTERRVENYERVHRRVERYETAKSTENTRCETKTYETARSAAKSTENTRCETKKCEKPRYKVDEKFESRTSEREELLRVMRARGEAPTYVAKPGKFARKLKLAAPYFIFYTAVQNAQLTWRQKLSVTMPELLDKSLGTIVRSLHLTLAVDLRWLICQYKLAEQTTDMLIFFSRWEGQQPPLPSNVKVHKVAPVNAFSVHNSKVSILQYDDGGIRVVVSGADLYREDWELRTQGLWFSPYLPRLPNTVTYLPSYGESRTGFKRDFLEYLSRYGSAMTQWCSIVEKCNFSAVNVAFVSSVPGSYPMEAEKILVAKSSPLWGHRRLAKILESHVEIPQEESSSTIIAQAASIGSLGPSYDSWIGSELVESMSRSVSRDRTRPDFQFVFPTIENYKDSYDMLNKSTCMNYTKFGHLKQRWITQYLCKWKASCSERTKAMPHIKTFTRVSADGSKMWWFVLGSANLSKAAWGWRQGRDYRVNNYEAGVVFLPKFLLQTGAKSFPIKSEAGSTTPNFPIPYDLPLTRYTSSDAPYFTDYFDVFHGKR